MPPELEVATQCARCHRWSVPRPDGWVCSACRVELEAGWPEDEVPAAEGT